MPRAELVRRVRFAATHRYHRPEWTDDENLTAFGACAAAEPHGHDYVCDVTVGGDLDTKTGMVVDLGLLDRLLDEHVVHALAGKLINDALPEFQSGGMIPTCESLAMVLAMRIGAALGAAGSRARLHAVRIAEDESLWAVWTADA